MSETPPTTPQSPTNPTHSYSSYLSQLQLFDAIKRLEEQIDTLATRIAALEGKDG